MSFAATIKQERERLGITQAQAASLLGVSKSVIEKWEADTRTPLEITQEELANHIGLSRRSVVGVLEKMEREGTLERGYGTFRINATALAQRAARSGLEFGSL